MWKYEKILAYPVNIKKRNLKFAKIMITQIGGFAGELGACLRYINQSYTMPDNEGKALLLEIGTEEMSHIEILAAMMLQLTCGATYEELKAEGMDANYVEHGFNFFPVDASGNPFSTLEYAVTGDYITDLNEDLAAEAKAKIVYERLMDLTDDKDILGPLSFLREREVVHYQRFAELLKHYQDMQNKRY